jgi:hypothetical protein
VRVWKHGEGWMKKKLDGRFGSRDAVELLSFLGNAVLLEKYWLP